MASSATYQVLLVAYIVPVLGINIIAFLISDFYRKKFSQPSPRLGFLAAIGLGVLAAVAAVFYPASPGLVRMAQSYLLLGSGILSIYSAVSLHLTMKRVRR